MVWYEDLYVGRLAQTQRDALISGIDSGNYPAGAWLITVPDNPLRQLEMYSAGELKHDYTREHCLLIIGLALTRAEATALLEKIVQDVYSERGDADIKAWLSAEHPHRNSQGTGRRE